MFKNIIKKEKKNNASNSFPYFYLSKNDIILR
jgi:hypothetical protein